MDSLLADTLRFIKENFSPDDSWIVSADQMHLKAASPVKKAPLKPAETIQRKPAPPQASAPVREKPQEAIKAKPQAPTLPPAPVQNSAPSIEPLPVKALSKSVKELFPEFTTLEQPPRLEELQVNPIYNKALRAEVVLFSFREGKSSDLFLQNISKAIEAQFCPSAVFDVKKWEILEGNFELFFSKARARLYIGSKELYQKPSLLPFLVQSPASSELHLAQTPFVLLESFSKYLENPTEKQKLWTTLCAHLRKTSAS